MSSFQMAPAGKFSYQKLRNEAMVDDGNFDRNRVILRSSRSWFRFKRVHRRRKLRLKVPSLRKFLRKKVSTMRISCAKICKRLWESQAYFGDLFAGNYLFVQVNPSSIKYLDNNHKGHYVSGLSSRCSLQRTNA
ncbi:Plexin-D1 like [Quillaja saponaria]|uniref:Plexin-D1 like n=1 Tax=Quillaja saponaria TaxID=32244 RepID=A0AAD7PWF6_QUISA|nr:Plexin-D1 like [Quillaja saponaria]